MPRLSESISDLVRRSEANKVVGFIGGEGCGVDTEDLFDFMAVAIFNFTDYGSGWAEILNASGVHNNDDATNVSTATLDEISQLRRRSSHRSDVINQNMEGTRLDDPLELGPRCDALHRVWLHWVPAMLNRRRKDSLFYQTRVFQ